MTVASFYTAIRQRSGFTSGEMYVSSRIGYCSTCGKRIRIGVPFLHDENVANLIGGNAKVCVPCMKLMAAELPKEK